MHAGVKTPTLHHVTRVFSNLTRRGEMGEGEEGG